MSGVDYHSRGFAAELAGLGAALAKLSGGAWRPNAFPPAFKAAVLAQRAFEDGLAAIGERALRAAREAGVPVVLVVGETHVLHEPLLNPGIHDLVAANGAIPVPVDCFPVPRDVPPLARVHWASAGRMLRASVAAARSGEASRCSSERTAAARTRSSSISSTTFSRSIRTRCWRRTGTAARPAT